MAGTRSGPGGGGVWAVVPAKAFSLAKQRLEPALPAGARSGLARAMLEDVLATLASVTEFAGVALVSREPAVRDLALRFSARLLPEARDAGLNGALAAASARLFVEERADAVMVVPGDVPAATRAEFRDVLAMRPAAGVLLVPDAAGVGTNALLVAPPGDLAFAFGTDSLAAHRLAAAAAGIELRIVEVPGLALDVDTPADLDRFLRLGTNTHAHRFLQAQGLAAVT